MPTALQKRPIEPHLRLVGEATEGHRVPDNLPEEFVVAKRCGFAPTALVSQAIDAALGWLQYSVLDRKEVWDYLTARREEDRAYHWHWRVLREKDVPNPKGGWGVVHGALGTYSSEDGFFEPPGGRCVERKGVTPWGTSTYQDVGHRPYPYDLPIPTGVLEKVIQIEEVVERFLGPDKLSFLVSHYVPRSRVKVDPVIAVLPRSSFREESSTLAKQHLRIFEIWDEPGFRK